MVKRNALLYLLFFGSGASALVYEIAWFRKLSLVFGTDAFALATVTAVFFTGLAAGSWLFGKFADRSSSALALYGVAELGIGVYAAFTPFVFQLIEAGQIALYRGISPSFGGFTFLTFLLSFAGLVIPTIFMGGTLPVIAKVLSVHDEKTDRVAGTLYAVNTAGSLLGVLASGFFLIAAFGVNWTIFLAAAVNIAIGLTALTFARLKAADKPVKADRGQPRASVKNIADRGQLRASVINIKELVILLAYAGAGFAAISLEVLWTRVLVMIIGASVYSFSLVLIAFLAGIALGSLLMARLIDRITRPLAILAALECALGFYVIFHLWLLGEVPYWFLWVYKSFGQSFGLLQLGIWLMLLAVMFVPTFLMGLAFPAAVHAYRNEVPAFPVAVHAYRSEGTAERVGRVYAANTIGGVAGALVAGFFFIPVFGLQMSFAVVAVLYMIIGAGLLYLTCVKRLTKILTTCTLLVVVLIGSGILPWDTAVFTAGFYADPASYANFKRQDIIKSLQASKIVYEADGASANVAVRDDFLGTLNLRINGKADASTGADMETQLLLGHIPAMLHPNPRQVLVVGVGSGITLGSVLTHGVDQVDAIEIEAKVIEAARFFSQYNNAALDDPRVNVIVADGRKYLGGTKKKYDVISSEPSNPWLSGSSKLFTKEYFELLKGGIREGGLVIHWVNLYSLDDLSLKSVLSAFRDVFPYIAVFALPASNDLALVGSIRPVGFDPARLSRLLQNEKIRADLARAGIGNPFELLSYFVLDREGVEKIAADAPANSDNRPIVEFSAPKSLFSPVTANPWRIIFDHLAPIDAVVATGDAQPGGEEILKNATKYRSNRLLTQIYFIEGNLERGIEAGESALEIDKDNPFLQETVARLYFDQGSAYLDNGYYAPAVKSFTRSMELKETAETHVNLGLSYLESGDLPAAKGAFEAAIKMKNDFALAYFKLGEIAKKLGDVAKARQYLEEALRLDPDLTEARDLLRTLAK